jgi:hypothetical protein
VLSEPAHGDGRLGRQRALFVRAVVEHPTTERAGEGGTPWASPRGSGSRAREGRQRRQRPAGARRPKRAGPRSRAAARQSRASSSRGPAASSSARSARTKLEDDRTRRCERVRRSPGCGSEAPAARPAPESQPAARRSARPAAGSGARLSGGRPGPAFATSGGTNCHAGEPQPHPRLTLGLVAHAHGLHARGGTASAWRRRGHFLSGYYTGIGHHEGLSDVEMPL